VTKPKGKALAITKTPAQKAAETQRAKREQAAALERANAQRLAQIINLTISGHSLADIAIATGSTVDEVERLLTTDMSRYVRSQPALRVYVRNFISSKYAKLLEADWKDATVDDPTDYRKKLEHQDRVLKILREMDRLHGAAAPTQSEIKVDAAPEAVEALVNRLSSAQGLGYDAAIFDVVDAEVVHEAVEASAAAEYDAGEAVGETADDEEDL